MLQFWADTADGPDLSSLVSPASLPSDDSAGTC